MQAKSKKTRWPRAVIPWRKRFYWRPQNSLAEETEGAPGWQTCFADDATGLRWHVRPAQHGEMPRLAKGKPGWQNALSLGAMLEGLIDHLVKSAANPSRSRFLLDSLPRLMPSSVDSMTFAGLKLGGNERGGNSWKVATNLNTSSIIP